MLLIDKQSGSKSNEAVFQAWLISVILIFYLIKLVGRIQAVFVARD